MLKLLLICLPNPSSPLSGHDLMLFLTNESIFLCVLQVQVGEADVGSPAGPSVRATEQLHSQTDKVELSKLHTFF